MAAEKDNSLEPALVVEPTTRDFNPNLIPRNGSEYLQQVHHEAKKCRQIVVANMNRKKFQRNKHANYYAYPVINVEHCELLPTLDWQYDRVTDFSDVRETIDRRKEVQMRHRAQLCSLPFIGDKEGWFKFCVGEQHPETKSEEVNDDEGPPAKRREYEANKPKDPQLHLLAVMSQFNIVTVLDYYIEWLETGRTDFVSSGPWLYALLACLEIPLTPDTCSSLRCLARVAALERSKLTLTETTGLNTENLIICLVGRYFRQFDLADG